MTAAEIAQRSVRGSLILFAGNFIYTAISAVAIILIARLLGPSEYGVYTLAFVIPGLLQLFFGFSVNDAIIRYSAYYISLGRLDDARRYTTNGVHFLWLAGLAFSLLNYILAGTLTVFLLHRPDLTPLVQLMSLSVFGSMILLTVTSPAMGWNWMSLTSLSQILQAVLKLVLSPLLIVFGLGVTGALVGNVASLIIAGFLGVFVFYLARLRGPIAGGRFTADVKEMLRFAMPLYASGPIAGLAGYYVTIILANIASNTVLGLYQAAANFVTPITLVSSALVGSLFPAFASLDGMRGNVQFGFRQAYKFVAFLLTPVIFFILSASRLLIGLLYGTSFLGSVTYLELLALSYIPIAFGYTVHPAFFNGLGRPRLTMLVYLSGAGTLLVCAPLLSIQFGLGVNGLIYASFLSYFAAWVIGTILAARYMNATLDLKANGAILIVSTVSYAMTLVVPKVPFSNLLNLLLDLVVFFGLYLTLTPIAGVVKKLDIDIMDSAFRDLPLVGPFFRLLLRYERLVLSLRS